MNIPLRRYWNLLHQYLRPQWKRVLLLNVLLLSGIFLQVLNPQLIRHFIDAAVAGDTLQQLLLAAVTFLVFSLIIQGLGVAAVYVGENIGWRATNALRADLARYCLQLDMSFHNERTPGEMIERIDGDVIDLAIFFSQITIRVLGNLLLLAGVLLALYLQDWRIGLALTLYATLSLYGLNRLRSVSVKYWLAAREADAALFGFVEERLSGMEDIRSNGAEAYTLRDLYKFDRTRLDRQRIAGVMDTRLVQLWIGLYEMGRIIALVGGFYLFTQQTITIGTVYLIVNYTDAIFRPLREITNQIQNLQKAGGSIGRIEQLYSIPNKIESTGTETLPSGPLSVAFDHVHFSYNARDPILTDLSFTLEPNKVLGLLGRTGSGKTTITRLLFRLYDVNVGSICLNGIPIRDIKLEELNRHIGMVTQDVQLFGATVRDNMTFFDRSIPDSRIMEVLDELALMDWYQTLVNGLDTQLEGSGKSLSAGEGQLLAFTRIFLKNPGLVILDEASSRLDPATEQRIERATDKLLRNRTGIIVAHRLKTVHRADQIMILDNGTIREYGNYSELATDETSQFYSLLKTGLEGVLA